MALQSLLRTKEEETLAVLHKWLSDDRDYLKMRAVVAGIAEPDLLKSPDFAEEALRLHRIVVSNMPENPGKLTAQFIALRKALGYTISVIVSSLPEQGFQFIEELCETKNANIMWIIRQNLEKKRLSSAFPEEMRRIHNLIKSR